MIKRLNYRILKLSGKLGNGKYVLLDEDDFFKYRNIKWWFEKNRYVYSKLGKLHRLILKANPSEIVDHINHNILDNRKCNLRLCSKQNNSWNTSISGEGTSKYKGVCLQQGKTDRWTAQIHINDAKVHIGIYDLEEDAARAYNKKAKELFGEYACLNDVDGWEDFKYKKSRKKYLSKSLYYGVSYSNTGVHKKWIASVYIAYAKMKYLGAHFTEVDAALAYNKYVIENNLDKPLNVIKEE